MIDCIILSCILNGKFVEILFGYNLYDVKFFGLIKIWCLFLLVKCMILFLIEG